MSVSSKVCRLELADGSSDTVDKLTSKDVRGSFKVKVGVTKLRRLSVL